jgi:hypothetical protein
VRDGAIAAKSMAANNSRASLRDCFVHRRSNACGMDFAERRCRERHSFAHAMPTMIRNESRRGGDARADDRTAVGRAH